MWDRAKLGSAPDLLLFHGAGRGLPCSVYSSCAVYTLLGRCHNSTGWIHRTSNMPCLHRWSYLFIFILLWGSAIQFTIMCKYHHNVTFEFLLWPLMKRFIECLWRDFWWRDLLGTFCSMLGNLISEVGSPAAFKLICLWSCISLRLN
jgi:hypothetical protein